MNAVEHVNSNICKLHRAERHEHSTHHGISGFTRFPQLYIILREMSRRTRLDLGLGDVCARPCAVCALSEVTSIRNKHLGLQGPTLPVAVVIPSPGHFFVPTSATLSDSDIRTYVCGIFGEC